MKNFQTFFYGEVQRRISKDTQLVHDFVSAFSSHPRPCGRLCMIQFSNIGHVCCTDQQSCGDFDAICVEKSIGTSIFVFISINIVPTPHVRQLLLPIINYIKGHFLVPHAYFCAHKQFRKFTHFGGPPFFETTEGLDRLFPKNSNGLVFYFVSG